MAQSPSEPRQLIPCLSRSDWDADRPWTTDKIAIDGLRLVANAGFDAFGRQKSQSIEINVELALAQSTSSAAAFDVLDGSTVHYGELGKTIVSRAHAIEKDWHSSWGLLNDLEETVLYFAQARTAIAWTSLSVRFTKASLASAHGWSLCMNRNLVKDNISLEYKLQQFEMPILIGVNAHERTMKQKTVVDLTIDRINPHVADECYQVEQTLTKTAEESSFETLEALVEAVAANIIKYFILSTHTQHINYLPPAGVRVRASKPLAITAADGAVVEIYRTTESPFGRKMMNELGSKRPRIPFPLQGRLDEFLQSWKQD